MTSTRAAAFIAVLAVIGLVVSVAAVWPQPTPDPPVRDVVLGSPVAAQNRPPPPDGRRPVRVTVPGIDYAAQVLPVGVASDGQMELPPDPRFLGWYRFGPAPSQRGSTVLAGHLDSRRFGLGPLVRLRAVEPGDAVDVVAADGTTTAYSVVRVERFDRQALPARLFARTGPERLRLITCGGGFDAAAGGYQRNLVVTAVLR